jgi:hypothetical protein
MRTGQERYFLPVELTLFLGLFDVAAFAVRGKYPCTSWKQDLVLPFAIPKQSYGHVTEWDGECLLCATFGIWTIERASIKIHVFPSDGSCV